MTQSSGLNATQDARPELKGLLDAHQITQAEVATGIGRSEAMVSRIVNGEATPSKETIDNLLAFLSSRLRRRVTYEELFGVSYRVSS